MRGATNRARITVERVFARPTGRKRRPSYRSRIYLFDVDTGYARMNFPMMNEAVRAGDRATTLQEPADLAARFGNAASAVEAATRGLQGGAARRSGNRHATVTGLR